VQARYKLRNKKAFLFGEYLKQHQTMCFLAPNLSALSQISIRIPNSPTAQQHSLKRCPVRRCFGPLTVATDLLHLCGPTTNFRIAPGDQRGPEGASPAQLSGSKITFFIVFSHLESGPECKGIVCILAKSLLNLQGSTFLTEHSTQDITENLACFLMSSVPT
jgi:hypothetical protein